MIDRTLRAKRVFGVVTTKAIAIAIGLNWGGGDSDAHGQIPQSEIVVNLTEFTTGLGGATHVSPTDLVPLNDGAGRMAVATINGVVRLIDASGDFLDSVSDPYLDTRNEPNRFIPGNFPFGMTTVAFHPDFVSSGFAGFGKLYTIITETKHGTNPINADLLSGQVHGQGAHQDVLVEWTTNAPASNNPAFLRRDVLRFDRPHENHNVTDIAFGPDGLLYMTSGDGGTGAREAAAQQSENHLGAVLRIDPLDPDASGVRSVTHTGGWIEKGAQNNTNPVNPIYRVPSGIGGNPGAGIPVEVQEIYAIGFRSPYRLNFDRQTGDLYVGDVGEGQREEVDRVVLDGNYGWGRFEGSLLHDANISMENNDLHKLPIFQYGRSEGETVIGGFVYRGSALPELQGKYVFADFGRQVAGSQVPTPARLFVGNLATGAIEELQIDPFGERLVQTGVGGALISRQFILSIGEDALGELYLVVGDDPQFPRAIEPDGRILRMQPALVVGVPGDINQDGVVDDDDVADFIVGWKSTGHATPTEQIMAGDLNLDGITDLGDWHILRVNHPGGGGLSLAELLNAARVPEPATGLLVLVVLAVGYLSRSFSGARRIRIG
ncbi:MAG: PQQ-dependent sugar dehydrogenase [Pirellulales bacterium]|nr:PQQ-dependent sugar dehydrogenase [Pirellulales bacterium]